MRIDLDHAYHLVCLHLRLVSVVVTFVQCNRARLKQNNMILRGVMTPCENSVIHVDKMYCATMKSV